MGVMLKLSPVAKNRRMRWSARFTTEAVARRLRSRRWIRAESGRREKLPKDWDASSVASPRVSNAMIRPRLCTLQRWAPTSSENDDSFQSAVLLPYSTQVRVAENTMRAPPSASDGSTLKPVTTSPAAISPAPVTADHRKGSAMELFCTDPSKLKNRWFLCATQCTGLSTAMPVLMGTSTSPSNSKPRFTPSAP